jgi:type II secretory pathway component PulM
VILDLESLREVLRRPLAIALCIVVILGIAYVFTVAMNASIASARGDLQRNRAILDVARARVAESAALARGGVPPQQDRPEEAIERVLRERGIAYRSATGDAQVAGARGVVIDAVPFDTLVAALDVLAREHRVRAVDANIAARVEPGVVRAELLLAR